VTGGGRGGGWGDKGASVSCVVVWASLQESIERILSEGKTKAPMKYFEAIDLEGFTLGAYNTPGLWPAQ
jgi:hypothetical protein